MKKERGTKSGMEKVKNIIYILLFLIAAGGFWMQFSEFKGQPSSHEMQMMTVQMNNNTKQIEELTDGIHNTTMNIGILIQTYEEYQEWFNDIEKRLQELEANKTPSN
jgi:hypothetical protein